MKTAAISKLTASLSEYLDQVRAGEEIIVTNRGKAVARIAPLDRHGGALDSNLLLLERAGQATLGKAAIPAEFWKRSRPSDSRGLLVATLLEEREEGR